MRVGGARALSRMDRCALQEYGQATGGYLGALGMPTPPSPRGCENVNFWGQQLSVFFFAQVVRGQARGSMHRLVLGLVITMPDIFLYRK